jgi:HK97 family phage major capsid protein
MPYDSIINRTDAAALMPEEVSAAMMTNLSTRSAALQLGTRIAVGRAQTRFPVLSALPSAYWVDGDTGQKQTTDAAWDNKYINISEIACMVPVPDAVIADAANDIWAMVSGSVEAEFARVLDAAVFFGTNAPSVQPDDIVTAATAASNTVTQGANAAAAGGIAEDINDLIATIEADGYDPNGFFANRTFRQYLRGGRDSTGQRLLDINGQVDSVEGLPVAYGAPGLWPTGGGSAQLIAGDFTKLVIGLRQDMTFQIFSEGVIQDNTGAIRYNLMQQDMKALRCVMRVGWQIANVLTYEQSVEANRYPFAVLESD